MSTDPDDIDLSQFPPCVRIAGWIWIVAGGVVGIGTAFVAISTFSNRASGILICAGWIEVLAIWVLVTGVKTVRGDVEDLYAVGIGSIPIGLFGLASAVLGGLAASALPRGFDVYSIALICLFAMQGFSFLVAGVLALRGQSAYRVWREAYRPMGGELPEAQTDEACRQR